MQNETNPEQQAHTIGEQVYRLIRHTHIANDDLFTKQHIITAIKDSANTIATLNVLPKPYAACMSNALFHVLTSGYIDRESYREEIGLEIVKAGMDNTQRDTEGDTPLIVAAKKGYRKIAELLLKNGATLTENDIHSTKHNVPKNHKPLWTDFLVSDKDATDDNTPIMKAIKNQQYYWAELLLQYGAKLDENYSNKAFIEAMQNNNDSLAELLTKSGANITSVTAYIREKKDYKDNQLGFLKATIKEWHCILRNAIRSNDYPMFKKYLLKIGTVHVKGAAGSNLLHYAMASGNIRFVLTIFALAPGLIAQPDKTKGIPLKYWIGFDPQLNLVKALLAPLSDTKQYVDALKIPSDMLETEK